MKTTPTRIDGELFEAARAAGEDQSRSAAQQIHHWARIGRELELSPAVTHSEITKVLRGEGSYDELSDPGQAVVRVAWDEEITSRLDSLDLETELRRRNRPWSEAASDGTVGVRDDARDSRS